MGFHPCPRKRNDDIIVDETPKKAARVAYGSSNLLDEESQGGKGGISSPRPAFLKSAGPTSWRGQELVRNSFHGKAIGPGPSRAEP